MRRSLLIVSAVAVAGVAVLLGAFWLTRELCVRQLGWAGDDVRWLRQEFRLSDAAMARIRQLHADYKPRCQDFCRRIELKKLELKEGLNGAGTNVSASVEQTLAEIGALRAQCQAAMLRHFAEVSRVMPPEQGRRYLAEMRRLTLGFHEQVETSMAQPSASPHGHR